MKIACENFLAFGMNFVLGLGMKIDGEFSRHQGQPHSRWDHGANPKVEYGAFAVA
jgi:hypothetical protein